MKQETIIEGEVMKTFIIITVGCTYSIEKITLTDGEINNNALNEYGVDSREDYPMKRSYGTSLTCKIPMLDLGDEVEINDNMYLMRLA